MLFTPVKRSEEVHVGHEDIPKILKNRGRQPESRWQRYWRKRRMNAVRNSSDHASYMAIGILIAILVLGALLFFALRGADLPRRTGPGTPEVLKPGGP
jgi:hypothetical protein